MNDSEIEKKREKAKRYINEPERFQLLEIKLKMNSTHDIRYIEFAKWRWNCTCEFFQERSMCSHTMAAQEILRALLPKRADESNDIDLHP